MRRIFLGKIYHSLAKNIILPVYDFARNTHRVKYQKILETTQWHSTEEILENQKKKLQHLVKQCYETVPYYHKLFKENKIKPNEIQSLDDLTHIPLLEKTHIQNKKQELISTTIPKKELYEYHSGGTNYPINFLLTKEHNSWELAAEFRAYKWMGYELGDPCLYLGGSLNGNTKPNTLKRITNRLEKTKSINFHKVTEEEIKSIIEGIKEFNPEVIRASASSVYFIGQFMLREGLENIRPRLIITSAENLLQEQKNIVEEAFGCPVYDCYGSREFGSLASECSERYRYHITAENVLIEFIKDGEQVSPGEMGNIVITNLRNFGMPFLRYNIGDVGVPSDEKCNCGRGLPLMHTIGGRANDFLAFIDSETDLVVPLSNPVAIAGMLYKLPIQNFLIKQENLGEILIEIVPLTTYTQEHTKILLDHCENQLGEYLNFEVILVKDIPALPSGKRSIVKSCVSPFRR
jgi:phenylacetate-CoA ligase